MRSDLQSITIDCRTRNRFCNWKSKNRFLCNRLTSLEDKSTESIIIANGEQSVNSKDDKSSEGNDSGEKKVTFEENGVEKDAMAEGSNTQKNESS